MKPRQKDNFTDATEDFQSHNSDEDEVTDSHQALDNEGNPVTLGQNRQNRHPLPIKGKPLELSPALIEAIKKAVNDGMADAIKKYMEQLEKNSDSSHNHK
jgi:hypothetical protein